MKNRVITISREFGSGGRTIGKKVASRIRSFGSGALSRSMGSERRLPNSA